MSTETRNLPCRLNADELDQRRDRLAQLVPEIRDADAMRAAANKSANDAIKKLEDEAQQVATEIREKAEYREVQVERVPDRRRKVIEVIRQDTGEVVDSRAMTQEELQGKLFAVEAGG